MSLKPTSENDTGRTCDDSLEIGYFREWDCSVNFLPTLLVSDHTLCSLILERRKEGYGERQCILLHSIASLIAKIESSQLMHIPQ
jgi:hypothetical protein